MTTDDELVTRGELDRRLKDHTLLMDHHMRLMVQQVPALARRAVAVPSKRLGIVATVDGTGSAQVTLDGDTAAVTIQDAVPGGVAVDQRVVVDFYPPHGALITGVLGPP